MLTLHTLAPDFHLPDETEQLKSLSEQRGKWVLIYFYPKDDTSGCTKEACGLRDRADIYKKQDIVVLGISKDSSQSHKKFISKYKLPFTLLADTEGGVIKLYGAQGGFGTRRISYLINPDGIIEKIYQKVNPANHAEEVLHDIESFK